MRDTCSRWIKSKSDCENTNLSPERETRWQRMSFRVASAINNHPEHLIPSLKQATLNLNHVEAAKRTERSDNTKSSQENHSMKRCVSDQDKMSLPSTDRKYTQALREFIWIFLQTCTVFCLM